MTEMTLVEPEPPVEMLLSMSQEERRKWRAEKMNNQSEGRQKSEMGGNIVNTNIFLVAEQEACHFREHMGKQVENLKSVKAVKDTVNNREIEVRKEPLCRNTLKLLSQPSS